MTDETCCGACGYPIHATKEMACDWCRQSADRIEALTAKVKLMDDLDIINGEKIEALTAKLAKVVEAADRMLDAFCVHETQQQVEAYDSMCATLAEIEGKKT